MKAAILVNHTSLSESNYLILKHAQDLRDSGHDISISCLNLTDEVFPIVPIEDVEKSQSDIIVSTCIDTAELLSRMDVSATKFLFMWDIGLFLYAFDFERVYHILSSLEVVTRSQTHAAIMRCTLGIYSYIIPEFDLEKMYGLEQRNRGGIW
jgi:hypothetical protein